ncbi:LacI family DNA-binding transcriptional regulator [Yoonia algicola]|uniref:LacI family DNA-binding transcriptional regulator n=1 Tax=Yoonia algicola TaxID=3137368 RepID=A0AAN0M6G5_9RHOB
MTSKSTKRNTRVKLKDVAAASGVHYSTVSRVMRPGSSGRISEAVAQRVREVARELGYRSNVVAASLRTNSTLTIGLIVHDMSDPVYPPILSGIESILSPAGYSVLVANTGYNIDAELDIVDRMASHLVDGIFLATTRTEDPIVARCQDMSIPLISVLRQTESGQTSAVVNDCFGGMQKLVQNVIASGYRDIAVILAPQNISTARERWDAIQTTLQVAGIPLPDHRITFVDEMTTEEGERAASLLLAKTPQPPELIICVNDLVAVGAIRFCQAAGLRIPADISISGYNDIPLVDMIDPPLTTVRMRLGEIGKEAGTLMLAHLDQSDSPAQIIRVPSDLIVRGSLRDMKN